jgi:hypothetical protein
MAKQAIISKAIADIAECVSDLPLEKQRKVISSLIEIGEAIKEDVTESNKSIVVETLITFVSLVALYNLLK